MRGPEPGCGAETRVRRVAGREFWGVNWGTGREKLWRRMEGRRRRPADARWRGGIRESMVVVLLVVGAALTWEHTTMDAWC